MAPDTEDISGFDSYMKQYKAMLSVEEKAVTVLY